ncbi:MAG: GDSL-type esterase/lipase family protein [Blautia sp.]|nr:GDSL-type esterase/lipase family protein [Blautia sp.]
MFHNRFLFGAAEDSADSTRVTAGDLYQPDKGYGFVTEQNRREQEQLRIAELNSAFDAVYWYQDENLTKLQEDADGVFLDSDAAIAELTEKTGEQELGEHRRIPLSFKADVPCQGNYKVTVTICADEPMKDALIYTGRRRLGYRGDIPAGTFTHTMMVNVCDIVPRGHTERFADKTLDITVVADKPRISAMEVEEAECPTVYIAGDSTVTDQSADYPYAPGTSYSGWGQMISAYCNDRVAVSNHAHSGLTTESFRGEGHYAIVEECVRPGDFVFFQFAHNDQKLDALKARGGYHANLTRYITECREKGAYPLLVTPLARNTWKGNDGSYNDLLEEYAEVCKEIGQTMGVPVLDLHGLSMDFVVKHGLEASKPYYFPNDYTHSNDYGAYYMAGLVAGEITRACAGHQEAKYAFLAECVTAGFGSWEPAVEIVPPVKPAIYENVANPDEGGALLSEVENLSGNADRASVLDMIIKTARFFPTNVYNDMFTDVVGHEWYAGTVECAYQNGIIDENLVEEQRFYPEREVTLEEFLVFAMNGYKSRKTLPEEKECVYDDKCREFARPFVRAACAIGLIPPDGSVDLNQVITRGEAVEYCRKMKI